MFEKIIANGTLVLGLVQSGISLAVAFGVDFTDVQTGAILGTVGGLMTLLGALISPNIPVGFIGNGNTKVGVKKEAS